VYSYFVNFTSTKFARFSKKSTFEARSAQFSKICNCKNVTIFQISHSYLVIGFSGFYALNHNLGTVQYFVVEEYSQNLKILENFEKILFSLQRRS
jgi:hypothetical protein